MPGARSTDASVSVAWQEGAGRNDLADVISVDIGVQLWDKFGLSLKPENVHEAILRHIDSYIWAHLEDPAERPVVQVAPEGNGF